MENFDNNYPFTGAYMENIDEYYNSEYDLLTEKIFGLSYIKSSPYDHSTAEKCYCTSTENLAEYMKCFNLKNKRVATVGSSGDQVLNALLYGSRDITLIDANIYSMAFVEYKMAIIKHFDFETAMKLLGSKEAFHWRTYRQISHYLPKQVQQFWDKLMLEQDELDETVIYPNFNNFSAWDIDSNLIQGLFLRFSEFYFDENSYNKLRKILLENNFKLEYKISDLFNFPQNLKGKYDLILLANIYDYMETDSDKTQFRDTVKSLYDNNLNNGGTIQVNYEFSYYPGLQEDTNFGFEFRKQKVKRCNSYFKRFNSDYMDRVFFIDKPNDEEKTLEESSLSK